MASAEKGFLYGSICYLTVSALMLPYSAYCLVRFVSISKRNWTEKYFKHRHPISNILFLFCFFAATFIIDPLEVILGIIDYEKNSILSIIDIIDDITSVILFAIFISRVWFFFSDWSFHYNMSSWIWKREINPLHSNCIIKYRQIFGNKKCCILLIFFILFLPIIVILDIIPLFFINDSNEILFRIAIILLFVLFTLFILLSQLKRVLDVYNIRKELLYEISVFGALLLFSEILSNLLQHTNIINHTEQILLRSIFSTITGILVIYIGTNWVLNKFNQYKLFQSLGKYNVSKIDANNNDTDDLITILNTEQGFESFLLHLVNELQLEQMLFVIEVLQFKQQIKYRLKEMQLEKEYDKSSAEWLKLNYVINDVRGSTPDSTDCETMDVLKLSTINIESLGIPKHPRLNKWSLYQFAIHLYDKYIEDGVSLQLNLSAECGRFIYSYFQDRLISPETTPFPTPHRSPKMNKTSDIMKDIEIILEEDIDGDNAMKMELVTDDIMDDMNKKDGGYDASTARYIPEQSPEAGKNEKIIKAVGIDGIHGDGNMNVAYDLFRLYDNALIEVWNIISNEIFNRFKKTSEYGTIYEKIYNVKHIEQSNLINNHYNDDRGHTAMVPTISMSIDIEK